jgi:hypothetical protein
MKKTILALLITTPIWLTACSVSVSDPESENPAAPAANSPPEKGVAAEPVEEVILSGHQIANEDLIYRLSKAKRLVLKKNAVLELRDSDLKMNLESLISDNAKIMTFDSSELALDRDHPLASGKIQIRTVELKGPLKIEVHGQTGARGMTGLIGHEGRRGPDYIAPPPVPVPPGGFPITISAETVAQINHFLDHEMPCSEIIKWNQFTAGENGHPGQDGYPGESGGDTNDLHVEILAGSDSMTVTYQAGQGGPGGFGGDGGPGGLYGKGAELRPAQIQRCGDFSTLRAPQGATGRVGPRGYAGKKGQFLLNGEAK